MTLYGTPETTTMMTDNMTTGFGVRSTIEGFVNGSGGNGQSGNGARGQDAVASLRGQIGGLVQPAQAKVTGTGASPSAESSAEMAQRIAKDPALLAAPRSALAETEEEAPVVLTTKTK